MEIGIAKDIRQRFVGSPALQLMPELKLMITMGPFWHQEAVLHMAGDSGPRRGSPWAQALGWEQQEGPLCLPHGHILLLSTVTLLLWLPAPRTTLETQPTLAINTHTASSREEHYRTAELQIPNLGSEAPRRSVLGKLTQAGLICGAWAVLWLPSWQLSAPLSLGWQHDEEQRWHLLFQHLCSLRLAFINDEPPLTRCHGHTSF